MAEAEARALQFEAEAEAAEARVAVKRRAAQVEVMAARVESTDAQSDVVQVVAGSAALQTSGALAPAAK